MPFCCPILQRCAARTLPATCTGCGIIPLLWFRDRQQGPKMAYGVDIQPLAVEQLRFTIEQSDLGQRMQAVQADLSDLAALKEKLPFGSFDLVTCNPPYKRRSMVF